MDYHREQARADLERVREVIERYPEDADVLRPLEALHRGIAEGTHEPRPCQRADCREHRHDLGNEQMRVHALAYFLASAMGEEPPNNYVEARERLDGLRERACEALRRVRELGAASARIDEALTAADLPAAHPATLEALARESGELRPEAA